MNKYAKNIWRFIMIVIERINDFKIEVIKIYGGDKENTLLYLEYYK
jgi:ureidoglycolate hydrolase